MKFDLDDLTNSALKRMVRQLLTASDDEEKSILEQLMAKAKGTPKEAKNDLADLVEEKRGKSPKIPVEECDDCGEDDSMTEEEDS